VPDLSSVTVKLKSQRNARIPLWLGRAAQANFLQALASLHPDLSRAIHDAPGSKPFTSSNLLGARKQGEMILLQRGDILRLRYTTLHPQLTAIFYQGIVPQWENGKISLHDQPLQVIDIHMSDEGKEGSTQADYKQLLENASTQSTITMSFSSPTSFKRTGGYFTPLPQPELVFSSLLDRWNSFAPFRLPDSLYDLCHKDILILDANIQTETLTFARGHKGIVPGFIGKVTYRFSCDVQERRYLQALADFARFSGVGVKTTVGMGQVQVI
jgi:CRISPR-associated endoribonuclease Cas6